MIVETLIASVTAITVAGTWLGLRFAERVLRPSRHDAKERADALADVERWIRHGQRAEVRALLLCRPYVLDPYVRRRVAAWDQGEVTALPYDDARKTGTK